VSGSRGKRALSAGRGAQKRADQYRDLSSRPCGSCAWSLCCYTHLSVGQRRVHRLQVRGQTRYCLRAPGNCALYWLAITLLVTLLHSEDFLGWNNFFCIQVFQVIWNFYNYYIGYKLHRLKKIPFIQHGNLFAFENFTLKLLSKITSLFQILKAVVTNRPIYIYKYKQWNNLYF